MAGGEIFIIFNENDVSVISESKFELLIVVFLRAMKFLRNVLAFLENIEYSYAAEVSVELFTFFVCLE